MQERYFELETSEGRRHFNYYVILTSTGSSSEKEKGDVIAGKNTTLLPGMVWVGRARARNMEAICEDFHSKKIILCSLFFYHTATRDGLGGKGPRAKHGSDL